MKIDQIFELITLSLGGFMVDPINTSTEYGFVETVKNSEDFEYIYVDNSLDTFDDLMGSLAFYKWLGYQFVDDDFQGLRMVGCGQRDCFNCCMYRAFENYNRTETNIFLISPGPTAAYQYISCIEDCYITQ